MMRLEKHIRIYPERLGMVCWRVGLHSFLPPTLSKYNWHMLFLHLVMSDSLQPPECNIPGLPVRHHLLEFAQVHVHCISDAIQPSHLLTPSSAIFPSIRDFYNDSALHISWPNYQSFSFSISPSNEYSGLISFGVDWLDFLAIQGTLRSLLQHHSSKASIL